MRVSFKGSRAPCMGAKLPGAPTRVSFAAAEASGGGAMIVALMSAPAFDAPGFEAGVGGSPGCEGVETPGCDACAPGCEGAGAPGCEGVGTPGCIGTVA